MPFTRCRTRDRRPSRDRGGGRTGRSRPGRRPDSGQPDPKEPIAPLKLRPVRRALVDGQLLPQGEVLEGELAVAAAQEREESEQMEQEDDHRAKIFSESEQTDQPLAHRTEFWRRTGRARRVAAAGSPPAHRGPCVPALPSAVTE